MRNSVVGWPKDLTKAKLVPRFASLRPIRESLPPFLLVELGEDQQPEIWWKRDSFGLPWRPSPYRWPWPSLISEWWNAHFAVVWFLPPFFIASTDFCHSSRSYLTGAFLLFSNSNEGSTASSFPADFRNALVHRTFLGFFFFLKALWHLDRQNLKIFESFLTNWIPCPGYTGEEQK